MNPADSFNFQLKNTYKLEKSEGKKNHNQTDAPDPKRSNIKLNQTKIKNIEISRKNYKTTDEFQIN